MPSLEQRWEEQYDRLEAFLRAHGRLPRFFCEDKDEESIGSWIRSQRRSLAAGRLTVGRIARLRALPVPGVLDKIAPADRLDQLAAFQRVHGRLPLTTADKGSDEHRLAIFLVQHLRPRLKDGTLPKGDASRAARIPGAVMFGYRPDQDQKLEDLKAFIAGHGHLPRYSPKTPSDESRLAQWVNNMLSKQLDASVPETLERVERLRQVVDGAKPYNQYRAERIVHYAEEHLKEHRALPSASAVGQEEKQAYSWLMRRRLKGDADLYGHELAARIRALLSEGTGTDAAWTARLNDLVAYRKDHGKLPTGFHDGPIYRWLATQRSQYRKGTLSLLRENALRDIDGVLPPPPKPKKEKRPREKKPRVNFYLFAKSPASGEPAYVRVLDNGTEPAPEIEPRVILQDVHGHDLQESTP